LGDGFGNNLSGGAEAHDRDCDRSFCRQTAKAVGVRASGLSRAARHDRRRGFIPRREFPGRSRHRLIHTAQRRTGAVAGSIVLDQRPAGAIKGIALLQHVAGVILSDRVRAVVNIIGGCGVLTANIDGKIKEMKKGSKKDEWLKVPYLIFSCNRAYRTKTAHPAKVYTAEQADRAIQATKALLEEFSDLLPDPIEEMIG
jgi:hypothetical protein